MAVVTLSSTISRYMGVSTDEKPTDGDAGSTFYETDTHDLYMFNGTATWFKANPNITTGGYIGLSTDAKPTNAAI
ncbi:MAG: hypothetical protein PHR07_03895, partial [Acidaminococcaceae bacterium]|nr:hypothetical protein [Acidaminococcaceae bacterium]